MGIFRPARRCFWCGSPASPHSNGQLVKQPPRPGGEVDPVIPQLPWQAAAGLLIGRPVSSSPLESSQDACTHVGPKVPRNTRGSTRSPLSLQPELSQCQEQPPRLQLQVRIAVGWLALCTLARVSATGLAALKGPLLLFKTFSLFHLRGWQRAMGPACITVPFHLSAYLAS